MISKILEIPRPSLEFQKFFSLSLEQSFFNVGQNSLGNKIQFLNDGLRKESRILLPIEPHSIVTELRRGFQKKEKQTDY